MIFTKSLIQFFFFVIGVYDRTGAEARKKEPDDCLSGGTRFQLHPI